MRHLELDLSCISFARPLYRAPLPFPAPAPWQHNPGAVPHSTPGAGPSQHPLHNLQEARLPVGHVREHVPCQGTELAEDEAKRYDLHLRWSGVPVKGSMAARVQERVHLEPKDGPEGARERDAVHQRSSRALGRGHVTQLFGRADEKRRGACSAQNGGFISPSAEPGMPGPAAEVEHKPMDGARERDRFAADCQECT